VRPAEQRGRGRDVAVGQRAADPGRRVRLVVGFVVRRHEPEADDLEAEVRAHLLEQGDVAAALVAEVEVGPDHDHARPQQADEHLADELLRGLVAALLVEAEHADDVEQADVGEQLELLVERRQQLRAPTPGARPGPGDGRR
jgi:hypothetical protein